MSLVLSTSVVLSNSAKLATAVLTVPSNVVKLCSQKMAALHAVCVCAFIVCFLISLRRREISILMLPFNVPPE